MVHSGYTGGDEAVDRVDCGGGKACRWMRSGVDIGSKVHTGSYPNFSVALLLSYPQMHISKLSVGLTWSIGNTGRQLLAI